MQAGEHRNVHNPKLELSCYLHIPQKYPYNTGSNFRKFWFLWDVFRTSSILKHNLLLKQIFQFNHSQVASPLKYLKFGNLEKTFKQV